MTSLEFVVYGRPAPQGSKKWGASGQAYEQSRYLPEWRAAVKLAAERARLAVKWRTATGPCVLDILFSLQRAERPDPDAPWTHRLPAKQPDLDKLARGVADALKLAGAWADDALWVAGTLWKVYAGNPNDWPIIAGAEHLLTDENATQWTGAWIRLTRLSEMENDA